ncbi:FecR domain-containing protein [Pricia sp. S334]|uniref:FecR domain-containing protein n=1 Tax=Pricia mediterranea TaxID=3076079 RepID=A0ABU3L2Q0_9FLAO|nr:FecR domain-containing protein [Pricia sp. S334]MDT7828020.1 FecR domain-containing protein [Pricia sp. S334]
MKPDNTQKLIVKYITNSISAKELEKLDKLIQEPINEKEFWDFIKTNYRIDYNMKEFNTGESKKRLLDTIRMDKRVVFRRKFRKIFKYAAFAIFFLGMGYFIKQQLYKEHNKKTIVPKESFITLELGNGNVKVISEDGSSSVKDSQGEIVGSQVGKKLVYKKKNRSEKWVYNTLNVPYGKQFNLELSDGTVVYLNAGTSLKYPVKFLDGGQREVFLDGEAFFEVTENKKSPFIVNSGDMNVRVLGTKFNVSAYPEERNKVVVLVKGSVELYDKNRKKDRVGTTALKPGMKGNFDVERKNITTEPVITSIYTSWVDGELVFRNMAFSKILKRLERRYDVTIINKNVKLDNVEFNASFGNMPVGQIMEYFKSVYGIDYTVDQDRITIE